MKITPPNRIVRTCTQMIRGSVEDIFPLYCPVKEKDWCDGWDPVVVYTASGINEPDCVFITEDHGTESAWFVTQFDIAAGRVEMIKHTPGVIMSKLTIRLTPLSPGETKAVIRYGSTSLGPEGDEVLEQFTEDKYAESMDAWEKAMNHYLETGEMLTGLPRF